MFCLESVVIKNFIELKVLESSYMPNKIWADIRL